MNINMPPFQPNYLILKTHFIIISITINDQVFYSRKFIIKGYRLQSINNEFIMKYIQI